MKKHTRAFTYQPKIQPVRSGECTQTIRPWNPTKRGTEKGDQILFHGWEGAPYRTKWNWRLSVIVSEVFPIQLFDDQIEIATAAFCPTTEPYVFVQNSHSFKWDSLEANELAKLDYIDPPTGEGLRDLFKKMYGELNGQWFQVIRWNPVIQSKVPIQTTLEGTEAETKHDCCFHQEGKCIFGLKKQTCPGIRHCINVFVSVNEVSQT